MAFLLKYCSHVTSYFPGCMTTAGHVDGGFASLLVNGTREVRKTVSGAGFPPTPACTSWPQLLFPDPWYWLPGLTAEGNGCSWGHWHFTNRSAVGWLQDADMTLTQRSGGSVFCIVGVSHLIHGYLVMCILGRALGLGRDCFTPAKCAFQPWMCVPPPFFLGLKGLPSYQDLLAPAQRIWAEEASHPKV